MKKKERRREERERERGVGGKKKREEEGSAGVEHRGLPQLDKYLEFFARFLEPRCIEGRTRHHHHHHPPSG